MDSIRKISIAVIAALLLPLAGCHSVHTHTDEVEASVNSQNAASYNVQLGVAYFQRGELQRAKRKLLMALEQAPDWAPAQDAMGYFLLKTGDVQAAEPYFVRAIALDPTAGAAHNNYGTYLCQVKRYQEAEQHFLLAVQDKNYLNSAEAYENAGLCAIDQSDSAKAEAYLKKALAQDPQRRMALLELVKINIQQQQFKQAQSYLAAYRRIAGNDAASDLLARQIAGKVK